MKISELSQQTGVSQRMLRYIEEVGLLTPERSDKEYRQYSLEDQKRILEIRELQRLGLTLKEILKLKNSPAASEELLEEVFLREREVSLEKQRALRDLRERVTGKSYPYFEEREAYDVPGLDKVIWSLEELGWLNSKTTYKKFSEWQEGFAADFFMIGELVWQSGFYLLASENSQQSSLKIFMRDFSRAAHQQWPVFDAHPPRTLEKQDLGEFYAPSEIVINIEVMTAHQEKLTLLLPYQLLFALAK